MNISGFQNLIWLGSLVAGGYLGWYLYDFKQNELVLQERLTEAKFRDALEKDITIPEPEDHVEFDFPVVKRIYHDMNWTGIPPVEPVEVEQPTDQPTVASVTPVADLLDVLFVRAAPFDPERSQALVMYKAQGLRSAGSDNTAKLLIGDKLPSPYENIYVKDINDKGIVFGFDDEAREPELLAPPIVKGGIQIVKAGPDGALMPANVSGFEELPNPPAYRPQETVMIGRNRYRVGTDDAERFASDYASIIAQLGHRRHRNPTTGQYDGIEVQSVPANSIAAAHGVKSGDVIKSINGQPVSSVQEAIQYAKNHSDEYTTWTIVIENKGAERTVNYETPSS